MNKDSRFIRFLYTNILGRMILWFILNSGILTIVEKFLNTKLSRPLIALYVNMHHIDMSDYEGQTYHTFRDFFARRRIINNIDLTADHLISPCDGLLSVYPIGEDSLFRIKGSFYHMLDLVDEEGLVQLFQGGMCLIFRLRAVDYHHFCHIDDGFQYTNHFIEGTLHSVQPAACEKMAVYCLNRRMWTLMDTDNFGKIIQIGVGAFLVGEIVHESSCYEFRRGEEMGHFELAGSTIVMLFQRDQICLDKSIQNIVAVEGEVQVRMGQMIGRGKPK